MAVFYPPLDEIPNLRTPPTEGELKLLNYLNQCLKGKDDYEIFFQSNMEGYRPDIVIMRRGYGILIIEVKDYNIKRYYIDDKEEWHLAYDGKKNIVSYATGRDVQKGSV